MVGLGIRRPAFEYLSGCIIIRRVMNEGVYYIVFDNERECREFIHMYRVVADIGSFAQPNNSIVSTNEYFVSQVKYRLLGCLDHVADACARLECEMMYNPRHVPAIRRVDYIRNMVWWFEACKAFEDEGSWVDLSPNT